MTSEVAEVVRLSELTKKMDEVAVAGGDSFYVEILAAHGIRKPREAGDASLDDDEDLND